MMTDFHLGAAYRDSGLFDESINMYRMAVGLKPDLADAHAQLALSYKDNGRVPEAIGHFRKALHIQPEAPDALCNYVHTLIMLADWTDYETHMRLLERCLDQQLSGGQLPAVQPFHAFVYPIHLEKVKRLSIAYARRAAQVAFSLAEYKRSLGGPAPPYPHPPRDPTLGRSPSPPQCTHTLACALLSSSS